MASEKTPTIRNPAYIRAKRGGVKVKLARRKLDGKKPKTETINTQDRETSNFRNRIVATTSCQRKTNTKRETNGHCLEIDNLKKK